MTKRRSFTREFRLEAIRLLESGEKKAADLARELGVPRNRLYKWREQLQAKGRDGVFPGHGRRSACSVRRAHDLTHLHLAVALQQTATR